MQRAYTRPSNTQQTSLPQWIPRVRMAATACVPDVTMICCDAQSCHAWETRHRNEFDLIDWCGKQLPHSVNVHV
jgi:hypothetical protein